MSHGLAPSCKALAHFAAGNLLTVDSGAPYNLSLLTTQIAEVQGECSLVLPGFVMQYNDSWPAAASLKPGLAIPDFAECHRTCWLVAAASQQVHEQSQLP